MPITHAKVSAKSDGGDSSLVLPSDWNDDHDISGLLALHIISATYGGSNTEVNLGSTFTAVGGTLISFTQVVTGGAGGTTEGNPRIYVSGGSLFASAYYKVNIPEGWVWVWTGTVPGSGSVTLQMKGYRFNGSAPVTETQVVYYAP